MLKGWQILVIGSNLAWIAMSLQGCGQSGPLYLPPVTPAKATPQKIQSPASAPAPASNGTGANIEPRS